MLVSAIVCPWNAMWQLGHTLWRLLCIRITMTVFTPVHIPAILGHTCLHPAVPQHLHMVVQPCLFAYLLWYNTASETLNSPGQTCSISALWPHLFTPMPPHNATTRQHWLMLFESWSVSQHHAPSPPQTALTHLSTCLPVSCHSQGRNVCSHVYPSPEPLHGGRHVSSCICCVSVRCLTCLQACGIRAPRVDDIDICLHLRLVPVLLCSGVDILVDMFMSQGHHMAVQACQFLNLPCPGKATGQHEDLCLCLLHAQPWYSMLVHAPAVSRC